jgi:outer membrane protein TolC
MLNCRSAMVLLTIVFMPVSGAAQSALGLEQAIATALANNSDLRIARLAIDDSEQQVMLAWAEVMPTVTSSLNYTRSIELPVQFLPGEFFGGAPGTLVPIKFGADNSWQGGFTVNQTLFRGDAIVAISSRDVYRLAAKESSRATAQQVVTATRLAYYGVLIAEARLRLADASLTRLRANLAENRARAGAGLLDEYDVLRLDVQLANEEPRRAESQDVFDKALRDLNLALGLPVDAPIVVMGDLVSLDVFATEPADVNAELMRVDRMVPLMPVDQVNPSAHRGDLRTLDVQRRLKDREIFAIKTEFVPEITATYNRQWTDAFNGDITLADNWSRFQTVSVNVNLPLFNGWRRMTNLKRAQIERRGIDERVRFAEQNARNELTTAWQRLERAFETASSRKRAVEQARRGYEIALARYRNGVGSQLDVNDAEYQFQIAELNYAVLVFEYLSAKAQYDLSRGDVPFVDATR